MACPKLSCHPGGRKEYFIRDIELKGFFLRIGEPFSRPAALAAAPAGRDKHHAQLFQQLRLNDESMALGHCCVANVP